MTKLLLFVPALMLAQPVFSAETIGEKTKSVVNYGKREAKKGAHRTKEAFCMKGDAACAAEKAKHRAQEAGDYLKDKAEEVKNNVD